MSLPVDSIGISFNLKETNSPYTPKLAQIGANLYIPQRPCPHNLIFKADDHSILPLQMKPNFFLIFFFFKHWCTFSAFFTDSILHCFFRWRGQGELVALWFGLVFFSLPKISGVETGNFTSRRTAYLAVMMKTCIISSLNRLLQKDWEINQKTAWTGGLELQKWDEINEV